jgi:threonine synthase
MMNRYFTHLECSVCGTRHEAEIVHTVCRSCGKSLLARYDLARARRELKRDNLAADLPGFWKYAPLLPVRDPLHRMSLGEVVTSLVPLKNWGKEKGLSRIVVKDEGHLPTGSFKARGLALAVSRASELGVREVCIPSAGNAGGALAAYAALAGLRSHIYMPTETPEINISECHAYGAAVELVDGTISDAARRMNEQRKDHPEWFDVSTLKEPYRLEGKKTMGYELAEQLGWDLPDVVVYPTGGGTGLIGMWKAFREMEELGWIGSKRPRMVSVQSSGCAPIVEAYRQGRKDSEAWKDARTVASGLRVPKAFADYLILQALRESGGCAIAVSDETILRTISECASSDGLLLCPEGAAALAALPALQRTGFIAGDEHIMVFNTASGLKYPEALRLARQ